MVRDRARAVLCAVALGFLAAGALAAGRTYEFGVFPYLPQTKIHDLYAPMAREFEAKLGRQVQLGSRTGFAAFGEELRKETYDIAFVQPFDYVEAHDRHGYLPLARRSGDLEALIVVRHDSPLASLQDLTGKVVANPPVEAAVSQLTSMALLEAGIHPATGVRRDYGKNHLTCLRSVLIGAADACGTAEQALRTLESGQGGTRFRILHRTAPIPHALFVAHKRVSRRERDALLKTILGWPNTEEGRRILERGQFVPFVAAADVDYEVVRAYVRNRK